MRKLKQWARSSEFWKKICMYEVIFRSTGIVKAFRQKAVLVIGVIVIEKCLPEDFSIVPDNWIILYQCIVPYSKFYSVFGWKKKYKSNNIRRIHLVRNVRLGYFFGLKMNFRSRRSSSEEEIDTVFHAYFGDIPKENIQGLN